MFFLWALGLLFALALFMAGAHIKSRFQRAQISFGFVLAVLCGCGIASTLKSPPPSWATLRPVVEEAAAFRHDPPAITADWRRLQAGHRLTEDQWFAFRHWVNREQEIRARRVVERIVADHLRARTRKVPHSRTSKAL